MCIALISYNKILLQNHKLSSNFYAAAVLGLGLVGKLVMIS